jgi:hypothetical protein
MGTVCCLTRTPPAANCVDPANFDSLGCEKTDLVCQVPVDCPAGMACCLTLNADRTVGMLSCQPFVPCLGGNASYVECLSNADCSLARPMCTLISSSSVGDYRVCE